MISRINRWCCRYLLLMSSLLLFASLSFASGDSARAPIQPAPTHAQPLMSSHQQKSADTLPSEYFVIEISHRVFKNFHEIDTVAMNQRFPIGEGDEIGEVFVFNPDFSIGDSGKYLQLSDTLNNPAVRVRVVVKDSVIQQSWAFYYGSMPHFRRNDLLGFRLVDYRVGEKYFKPVQPRFTPVATPPDTSGHKK